MAYWWVIPLALVGAGVAALVNWAADVLPPGPRPRRTPALWLSENGGFRPERHLLVTVGCVVVIPMLGYRFGLSLTTLWLGAWAAILLLVAVIDFEHRLVLNKVLLAAGGLALLGSLARMSGTAPLPASLLGGVVGFVGFLIIALVGRGAMGAGDVKLAGAIGLLTGYPAVLGALLMGIIFGGMAALAAILMGRGRKSTIPYAPWLAMGTILVLLQAASVPAL